MKSLKHLLTLLMVWTVATTFAQVPQLINYQAVVRNSAGATVPNNTPVVLRFTIHDATATGTAVYIETSSTLNANQFGLVSTAIGKNASLSVVNWGTNTKWLQVEANINSAGFVDMGTQQLVSVPFALYALNSANGGATGATGPTGPQGNTETQVHKVILAQVQRELQELQVHKVQVVVLQVLLVLQVPMVLQALVEGLLV